MRREIAVVGMIACIAGGFLGGWFIPPLFTPARVSVLDQIKTRNLVIGTEALYEPFEFYNTTNGDELVGFDIDLCNMLAAALDVNITWVDMLFDSLIPACQGGTIDMIAAAMTIREDRIEQLAPSLAYIITGTALIGRNDSTLVITHLENLTLTPSVIVAAQAGSSLEQDLLDAGLTAPQLKTFPDVYGMMLDLINDLTIDAVYIDEPVYHAWNKVIALKLILRAKTEPFGLWTRYGEPELLNEMNKVILDGFVDGWMYDLYEKWLNFTT